MPLVGGVDRRWWTRGRHVVHLTSLAAEQFHAVAEQLAQREPPAMDAGLHSAHAHVRELRDLGVVIPVDVVEHDGRALVVRDALHRSRQGCALLGDESLKLRAEEGIKRLADDPDTAAVRRKVGGLPPQLSIFELGFAGKGRVYYTRAEDGRYRILLIGGKATQKQDLDYLSRL